MCCNLDWKLWGSSRALLGTFKKSYFTNQTLTTLVSLKGEKGAFQHHTVSYLLWPLKAYPAHRGALCITDEGEALIQFVFGKLLGRWGPLQFCLCEALCWGHTPVLEAETGVVVIGGTWAWDAFTLTLCGWWSAHGAEHRRRLWSLWSRRDLWGLRPEQQHLQVTEKNTAAALQHAGATLDPPLR